MNYIAIMDHLSALHNLVENVEGLRKWKNFLRHFGLILHKIAHIAILHNDEMVATIYIKHNPYLKMNFQAERYWHGWRSTLLVFIGKYVFLSFAL